MQRTTAVRCTGTVAARIRPTPHGEAISLVYTSPQARGRGYASAVVAQVSQRILGDGKRFCTLYADLAQGEILRPCGASG